MRICGALGADPAQTFVCRLSGRSLGAGLLNSSMMNAPLTRNQRQVHLKKRYYLIFHNFLNFKYFSK